MLLSIPSPLVLFSPPAISITSVTLDIGTPPSNIALQTPPLGNCLASPTSRRPLTMRRSGLKKMSTGPLRTQSRRTASAVAAAAIPISSMSRASKAAVLLSGLMWLAAGPPHKALLHTDEFASSLHRSLYLLLHAFPFSLEHLLGFVLPGRSFLLRFACYVEVLF